MRKNNLISNLILLILMCSAIIYAEDWQTISKGLEYGKFKLAVPSSSGNSTVDIVRINPDQYDFELLLASEHENKKRTIETWADDFELIGGINAGMFQQDYLTNTGYLVNYQHSNNPSRHSSYKMYFACNPKEKGLPEAQMIDWRQPKASELCEKYHSVVQGIRMIATGGRNVWSKQADKWSEAALGQDKDGNILLIFCSSPYTMHDLINLLLQLPLNLDKMMHLEGGPEASCYIETKEFHLRCVGTFESSFFDNEDQQSFWQIPNVIGFKIK
ncbi:MAG: phosphodiester glycosidase family protein [Candidatus Stygibacter frigidus]|nr:phosphodiester glycosidase family protein [Candidatus Stygibacter frigidus]